MLTVDDRTGSAELAPLLRSRGLPVRIGRLSFGDISFVGNGPDGDSTIPVGVEVKKIGDVLQCITNGRFAGHQLPGLLKCYDQVWLLIEGKWRPNPRDGILEVMKLSGRWEPASIGQRRFMYRDLLTWLFTIQTKAGVKVHVSSDWGEATIFISTLYSWWTNKEWEQHRAHLAINSSGDDRFRDRALLVRPTLLRLVAKELPGIGFDKSAAVAAVFGSVEALVSASEVELALVPGVGKKLAQQIWHSLRSER